MFLHLIIAMILGFTNPTNTIQTDDAPETPPITVPTAPTDPPGGDIGNNPPR
jgi:hypothetical protein